MKKQEFQIQIQHCSTYSKTIKADNMQEALEIAQEIVDNESPTFSKPANGWQEEWVDHRKIIGIFQ